MSPLTPRSAGIHPGFRRVSALVGLVVVLGLAGPIGASAPPSTDPTLEVTDGVRTMVVSKSQRLSEDGETVRVTGSGYDITKGIYVALCVIQPPDQQPSPCGGGIDRAGASGASIWISSNPPTYGSGLAIPYGEGGSFDVEFSVSPTINDAVDCRAVECAIVTKSDHTIAVDRSQDLVVPVTFAGVAPTTTVVESSVVDAPESSEVVSEITVAANVEDLARTAIGETSDGGSSSTVMVVVVMVVVVVVVVLVVVALVVLGVRRRRGDAS